MTPDSLRDAAQAVVEAWEGGGMGQTGYPGPSFIDGLLARCGVYWGEDPMAEPDDERRYWWMGTDGAGSVWAIEDEITIALIQQFTRVLANVAARMGIAAEQDALAAPRDPAPAPALDAERLAKALHEAQCDWMCGDDGLDPSSGHMKPEWWAGEARRLLATIDAERAAHAPALDAERTDFMSDFERGYRTGYAAGQHDKEMNRE